MRFYLFAGIGLFLAATALAQPSAPPDLILAGGKVFTGEPSKKWAEAVAIRGDRIVAVGTTREVESLAGEKTRRIDLQGRLVIPGINDAHTHQGPDPQPVFEMATTPESSWDDVRAAVAAAADETTPDVWITGTVSPRVMADPEATAETLGRVARGRKVRLEVFTGHMNLWSPAALQALRAGDRDPLGGWWVRDASGRSTGKSVEYANYNLWRTLSDSASDQQAVDALRAFSDRALRFGITSVQNMSALPAKRYEKVVREANVPLRIRIIRFPMTTAEAREMPDGRGATKWILDGTPIEHGAAVRGTYPGSKDAGRINFSDAEITAMLQESLKNDHPLLLHISGDRTAQTVLERMRAIKTDWKARRVRFEHGDGVVDDLQPAARDLGIVIVQNPSHFLSPTPFGAKGNYQPLASLIKRGIPVALGSDGPLNPFFNIRIAATHPRNPSEAITREQAVEAYTRGSAFAEFAEKEKGTIAVGKLADLAVLSQDIFQVPADQLDETRSVLTIVGGKIAYDAGAHP